MHARLIMQFETLFTVRNAHGKETTNGSIFPARARQIRANEPEPNPNPNPNQKPRSFTPNTKRSLHAQSIAFRIALFTVHVHGEYN